MTQTLEIMQCAQEKKKKLNADPFHFVIPQPNCTGSLSKSQFAGFSVYHEQMVFWGTEKPVK